MILEMCTISHKLLKSRRLFYLYCFCKSVDKNNGLGGKKKQIKKIKSCVTLQTAQCRFLNVSEPNNAASANTLVFVKTERPSSVYCK